MAAKFRIISVGKGVWLTYFFIAKDAAEPADESQGATKCLLNPYLRVLPISEMPPGCVLAAFSKCRPGSLTAPNLAFALMEPPRAQEQATR